MKENGTATMDIPVKLTEKNYYSHETDFQYLSKSIYWNFQNCEAEALAELKGEYTPERDNTPLLVGNYLHSYFESEKAHQVFLDEHQKELYKYGKQEKGLKKQYLEADNMIDTLEKDKLFDKLYQGDKEVIVTGKIDGILWKGKLDCLVPNKTAFLDLKTAQDFHKKFWSDEQHKYVNFAIAHGYVLQMAIYQELVKQTFGKQAMPYIVGVTKQNNPDHDIFSISQTDMDRELNDLVENQGRVKAVIDGQEKPTSCGHCDYCRLHKQLGAITPIEDIEIF